MKIEAPSRPSLLAKFANSSQVHCMNKASTWTLSNVELDPHMSCLRILPIPALSLASDVLYEIPLSSFLTCSYQPTLLKILTSLFHNPIFSEALQEHDQKSIQKPTL